MVSVTFHAGHYSGIEKFHFDHADELGHSPVDASVSTEGASRLFSDYLFAGR